jgi:carbon monoxide dehydrogenase subunit G
MQLDMWEPFEGHNVVEFTLAPEGAGTRVTWAMHGPSSFLPKLIGIFIDMDRMIGRDFEQGLANLKAIAEKP